MNTGQCLGLACFSFSNQSQSSPSWSQVLNPVAMSPPCKEPRTRFHVIFQPPPRFPPGLVVPSTDWGAWSLHPWNLEPNLLLEYSHSIVFWAVSLNIQRFPALVCKHGKISFSAYFPNYPGIVLDWSVCHMSLAHRPLYPLYF